MFTHGDLHPGNIIVRPDGKIVLLDWGLAGFWPEYWEFYRAMFNPAWRVSWDRSVERFIPPYYVEYRVISTVFGVVRWRGISAPLADSNTAAILLALDCQKNSRRRLLSCLMIACLFQSAVIAHFSSYSDLYISKSESVSLLITHKLFPDPIL